MRRLLWLAHFLFSLFCHLNFQATCKIVCNHDQSLALLQFKKSLSITTIPPTRNYSYPKTETWKEGTDCCWWDGITCDKQTGNVIELDLSSSLLEGTFNSNTSLSSLAHLQKLDLSNNDFNSSQISPQFGQLLNLIFLNLNLSNFAGPVPPEISQLSNLVSLDLSWNYGLTLEATTFNKLVQNLTKLQELHLTDVDMSLVAPTFLMNLTSSLSSLKLMSCGLQGKVPDITHLSKLVSIDLSWNGLSIETMTFDKLVRNLTNLREVDFSSVNMSLVAPTSFMNLSSSCSSLILSYCELQWKFPYIINLSELLSLDLSSNYDLTPETTTLYKLVQNLTKLQKLDLSFINMSLIAPNILMNLSSSLSSLTLPFSGLQGKFPGNIIQLPNLQVLELSYNEDLTGSFPLSNWSRSLIFLSLSITKIPLYLENDFFKNLKSLQTLLLSSCNFVGSNIALFGNLSQLTWLDLSYNNFSGQIPSSIGKLEQLNDLDLSYNNFSGQIPSSIGNLEQLNYLDLSYNNFSGQIPSSFANLKHLRQLNIKSSNINGQIPNYFTNLTKLSRLILSKNRLSGPIPSEMGRLSRLFYLDLSNNFLNATIPSSLFALPLTKLFLNNNWLMGPIGQFQYNTLSYLDLSHNKLYGSIPSSIFKLVDLDVLILSSNDKLTGEVSSAVCELKFLQILDLSNNNFSGSIPQCLGNFSNILSVLHLGMSNFHGAIPETFSGDSNLRYLNLNGNQLQGRIPPSISNCKNLEILDLGNNKIDDRFPYFLGTLTELQILVLQSNKLHGLVEGSIANYSFPKVRVFDLSDNMFSGPLPAGYLNNFKAMMDFDQNMKYMRAPNFSYDYSVTLTLKGLEIELVKIQTLLSTIDLSNNRFTGKIPQSIGKLKSLKQLNISHNHLTGNIEPSLRNLTNLESLDLSSNLLTGRIPLQLTDLTFLQIFRVSNNQLEGPIPQGKQFNTFENDSYEGNVGLCGFPLQKECNNGESQQPTPSKEDDLKYENGFGWKPVLAGYGCGLVFGLAIGFIVFKTRKPKWFVKMVEGEGYQKPRKLNKRACRTNGRRNLPMQLVFPGT